MDHESKSRFFLFFLSVCIIISFVHTFDVSLHHLFLFMAAFVHEINKGRVVRRGDQLLIRSAFSPSGHYCTVIDGWRTWQCGRGC